MVGMHHGWVAGIFALAAAASMLIRVVSRIVPGATVETGSPTNELIRHMLFVLLLARVFSFDVEIVLAAIFTLHAVSMIVPYRMPGLIRRVTKSAFSIGLVNVALVAAWLIPYATPVVALAFGSTYLYGFVVGGVNQLQVSRNR
jgi:hypothetical protein